jgi:hypothetical protein
MRATHVASAEKQSYPNHRIERLQYGPKAARNDCSFCDLVNRVGPHTRHGRPNWTASAL